jgi:hypothetical protein
MTIAKIALLLAGLFAVFSVILLVKGFWEGIIGQGGVGSFDLMYKSLILSGFCLMVGIVARIAGR